MTDPLLDQALRLERGGDRAGAAALYRRILEGDSFHPGACNNLALLLLGDQQPTAAAELCREALHGHPDDVALINTMARIELGRGRAEAAVELLREGWRRHPAHLVTGSNLMLALNYPELPPEEVSDAHCRWGETALRTSPVAPYSPPERSGPAGRRLRVGYVSADFRRHSVTFFVEALFHFHDREKFEIHLFADVPEPDFVTGRLRAGAEYWHDLAGMDNAAVAAYLRRQEMDILVDLAGHTGRRLEVFARRCAPVQVTWLGYPNTTGVAAMDWRLTDDLADSPEYDRYYTERQYRLPGGMWAYSPPEQAPEPVPPPCLSRNEFTFGSFNHIAKISAATERLWSAVLRAVPGSRLLLKHASFADPAVAAALRERFARGGVAPERVVTRPFNPVLEDHLRDYEDIDLALDTWPYNGTTTTFESLWMGVPVLTMRGPGHAARTGAAIMGRLGLERFVAADRRELVGRAMTLAQAPELLRELRGRMRPLLAASPLTDGRRLAVEMEHFFTAAANSDPV